MRDWHVRNGSPKAAIHRLHYVKHSTETRFQEEITATALIDCTDSPVTPINGSL